MHAPVDGCSVINERIKVFNPLLISGHLMQLAMLLRKADPVAHGSANQYKVAFPMLLILQGWSFCFSAGSKQQAAAMNLITVFCFWFEFPPTLHFALCINFDLFCLFVFVE